VSLISPTVVVARHAMATRFEVALHGPNPAALRAAAEEALDEIEHLEARLSIYRPTSDLSQINAHAAQHPVRVDPRVFQFLLRARQLSSLTHGAFDITAAPLFRAWGFIGGSGSLPTPESLASARACVGWHHIELNESNHTVAFDRPGVLIDPGAIGKGYAMDRASELLRDAGVESALFHGGTSTVCAIGHPPGEDAWSIALPSPPKSHRMPGSSPIPSEDPRIVRIHDQSLSVSAVWGKSFEIGGRNFGHVLDPRSGEPVSGASIAAVITPGATESDAVSTALLVLGFEGIDLLQQAFPGSQMIVG
jgi:thiamine biosynthesis lipoprotein